MYYNLLGTIFPRKLPKQKLFFPAFTEKKWGAKNLKKQSKVFCFESSLNTPKQLANKFVAYATSLTIFPCFANLALTSLLYRQCKVLANYIALTPTHPCARKRCSLIIIFYIHFDSVTVFIFLFCLKIHF